MSVQVELIPGPLTSEMARTSAETSLRRHTAIAKGASYALEQIDGRWVAAIVHTADVPFGGGGPADSEEEAPAPKSEGPDDTEPSLDGGDKPPSPDGDSDGPPSGEKSEKGKGGEKGEVHQVLEMLHQIVEALGLPIGLGESPVPGADGSDVPVPPPAGPPHGPGGPPGMPGGPDAGPPGPGGPGGAAVQKVIHDRVTKPGETPPGGTPVGAPAFGSVRKDHPWAHLAGKVASFTIASEIGDSPMTEVNEELQVLAKEIGYHVSRLRETSDNAGNRVAEAAITAH